MFKRKRKCAGIPAYPADFTAIIVKTYSGIAKRCVRLGDAAGYRRASDMMREVTRTI